MEQLPQYRKVNDLVISAHGYWAREKIPSMIEDINEDLVDSGKLTKMEKSELNNALVLLQQLQVISMRLSNRKMSFVP